PGWSIRTTIWGPDADPACTDSQQVPREATSTIRAAVGVCFTVRGAGVVLRVVADGGRSGARWWLPGLERCHAISPTRTAATGSACPARFGTGRACDACAPRGGCCRSRTRRTPKELDSQ